MPAVASNDRQGLGLVGCGRFGRFLLGSLASLPELELAALASRGEENLEAAARAWAEARTGAAGGAPRRYRDWRALVADPGVGLVLVATPPALHAPVTRAALEAGKHVLVEKPGALDPADLDAAAALARRRGLAAAPDFVLRWNPIWRLLAGAAAAGLLGPLERAAVENHAHGDLPPTHWFWDPARSGGILVEHGVHFLDLMRWLFGPARPEAYLAAPHPAGPGLAAARVLAVYRHGDGVASHYHAFTRPPGLAAARVTVATRRAHLEVEGWTAHALDARLALSPGDGERLRGLAAALLPDAAVWSLAPAAADGRGAPWRLRVELGDPEAVYAEGVRAGVRALLARARGGNAPPGAPTLEDAAAALRLALAAPHFFAGGAETMPAPAGPAGEGCSP